jgi:Uma2 family endonuclease
MSEEEFREFSLSDEDSRWELVRGELQERGEMTARHGGVMDNVAAMLHQQLDRREFRLRIQHARLRVSADTYYIPDIAVIPTAMERTLLQDPGMLDAYPDPLPLVVEIWSPSTGTFDVDVKIPDYQRRGDQEIWFAHPVERTLTTWSRQPDGTYARTVYRSGIVEPPPLPGVVIDIDELFAP